MTKGQRIRAVLGAVLMLLTAWIMIRIPEIGYLIIVVILGIGLVIYGIRMLIYYFTMARLMVGGQAVLIIGIIALDFGMFTGTIANLPKIYILAYLVFTYGFAGVIDVLRGLEAKRYNAQNWKGKIIYGGVNVLVAIVCICFIRQTEVLVYIYSGGLFYSAILRIINAFRRTAIVYIQ